VNPGDTYCDVEMAVLEWMRRNDTLSKYQRATDLEREAMERTLLAALQQKYAGILLSPELLSRPAQLSMSKMSVTGFHAQRLLCLYQAKGRADATGTNRTTPCATSECYASRASAPETQVQVAKKTRFPA
jgi:hypothetical protein